MVSEEYVEKIWIFTDEHHAEHEFSDPYEMMKYMWHHYIEDDVKIGWKVRKNEEDNEDE